MLAIHNTIINSATTTGIALKRWKLSEVIMIQKEIKNPRINRLRVLNKYEADLNLVFNFFWIKLTTNHLESRNLLVENQWGARPHQSAENVSLLNEIINKIHRITCKPLVKLHNDATACYDRMICNLSTLCSRSFGVPSQVCKLQANTLNIMEYKIQTNHGVSNKTYKSTKATPIHGQGQGSGHTGTSLVFNSVPMMKVIEKNVKDAK